MKYKRSIVINWRSKDLEFNGDSVKRRSRYPIRTRVAKEERICSLIVIR